MIAARARRTTAGSALTTGILATLAAALAGCGGSSGPEIAIDLEVPSADQGGALLDDLDALVFQVSDGRDFRSTEVYPLTDGLPGMLDLADVPTGDSVLFHLSGTARGAEVAYGRTCRLLVTEAGLPDNALPPRLYFSRVGQFRDGPAPQVTNRVQGCMFSDDRGRAVMVGGSSEKTVEVFDPRVGSFTAIATATPRMGAKLAARGDGTAVIVGGVSPDDPTTLVGAVEAIDTGSSETVQTVGQNQVLRTEETLTALPDRSILLTGGRDQSGAIQNGVSILAEGDDQFRGVTALDEARTGHTASLGLGGAVYLIGGLTLDISTSQELAATSIELFRPQDMSIRTLPAAQLDVPRFGHTATVLGDGRILIVGGRVPHDPPCLPPAEPCYDAVEEVELFDPIVGETQVADSIPGGLYDHAATLLSDGRVLITGGRDTTGAVRDDAWLFDPAPDVEALVPTRALGHARAQHTASELCDGTVLLVGGEGDDGGALPAERYNPAARAVP